MTKGGLASEARERGLGDHINVKISRMERSNFERPKCYTIINQDSFNLELVDLRKTPTLQGTA